MGEDQEEIDRIKAEREEHIVLLDKGIEFRAGKKKYLLKQPYLSTMDHMASELIRLSVNQDRLDSDNPMEIFEEQKRMLKPNALVLARIIAVMYLSKDWKIRMFTWYYARKFANSITPSDMIKLTSIILKITNFPDFSNSIALLAVNRTTMPQAMED